MVVILRNYFANDATKHLLLISWFSINVVLFYYTFMHYYNGIQFYYLHQMLGYGLCISRASAACINLNSSILLIPMCKRLITYLRGVKQIVGRQGKRLLDRGRYFHIYCGHLLCLLALIHCGAHIYNAIYFSKHYNEKYTELNVAKYANQNPLIMLVTTLPGITGLLLVATLVVIAGFASKPIRRKKHSRFWTTHHLFTLYYLLLFLHSLDGVVKYQTNVHQHVPGCYMVLDMTNSSEQGSVIVPEPEPHPELPAMNLLRDMQKKKVQIRNHVKKNKDTKKHVLNPNMVKKDISPSKSDLLYHPVVVPEPEPMSKDGALFQFVANISHGNNSVSTKMCDQPPPTFTSCPREVWRWLCIPLALYFIERLMRIISSSRNSATIEGFCQHPGDVIELKLTQEGFSARPGQTILVRCPSISQVELHPFSLTSVPSKSDPTFGIHMKIVGNWTNQLRENLLQHTSYDEEKQHFQNSSLKNSEDIHVLHSNRRDICATNSAKGRSSSNQSYPIDEVPYTCEDICCDKAFSTIRQQGKTIVESDSCDIQILPYHSTWSQSCRVVTDVGYDTKSNCSNNAKESCPITLYIEGPLGSAMEDVHNYKVSLCVAGGIGITPFASLLNCFLKDRDIWKKTKLHRLHLHWACKSLHSFQWLLAVIEELQIMLCKNNRPDFLSVRLYVTGNQDKESQISMSTINRCALTLSRPDFKEIANDISSRHPKCTVGVFSCGPRGLITALKKSCLSPSKSHKTKFVFNKEAF